METSQIHSLKNLKKGVLVCLKITLILGAGFCLFYKQFTLYGIVLTFVISSLYCFGLGLGNGLINEYLSAKFDWITETNQRLWAGVFATVFYTIPVVLSINYLILIKFQGGESALFFTGKYLWMHVFYVVLALAISAILHAKGFMIKWKAAMSTKTTKQEIVAKTETAKFESLKNQIDPHFLFNSLNVLTSLISENPEKAEKFTTKLSKIYRYVLEQRNKELTPLEEELNFAKTYMELLSMRFEDAVKFNIPDIVNSSELKIVPLSLQLLLENALKHNVVSSAKPLEITIYEKEGFLVIENNINPKETLGKSTKIGLRNIADRYGLITKKQLIIENNQHKFKVFLPLLTKTNYIMENNNLENSKYVKAVEKVEKLKEFYQNLTAYCLVIPFLIFINLRFSPQFHWFWFPIFGWGVGLTFHFLEVNNYSLFLGKKWEQKKIDEIMNKTKNN